MNAPGIEAARVDAAFAASAGFESTAEAPAVCPSAATKILYGVGGMSDAVKAFTLGVFQLFFYTTVLGVPGTMVGLAAALGLVWDAVIDPCVGYASDRTRGRFARRHGFMLAGALGSGIAFWALFNPPRLASPYLFAAWLVVTSLALRTAMSLFMVPYQALGAELSQDYHQRTSISGFRAAASLAGALAASVLSFLLFFRETGSGVDPKFDVDAYGRMGAGLGLLIALAGVAAVGGTRRVSTAPAAPARSAVAVWRGLAASLREAARHRAFLALVGSSSIFFFATIINASTAIHYLTYYARLTGTSSIAAFQLAFYLGAIAGVGIWLQLGRTIDKHRLYTGAVLATAVMLAASYLLVGDGRLLGTGHLLALCAGNALAGCSASALWVLPQSMVADVIDEDELAGGGRREGVFFGVASCGLQVAASVALIASGVLVDRFAGLVPGASVQSAMTADRVGMLFGLLPAALVAAAALLMVAYPLTSQRVRTVQAALAAARERRAS